MLSVGLIGWQVAGLVEYNFGDGEVRLIALMFMGFITVMSDVLIKKPAACHED